MLKIYFTLVLITVALGFYSFHSLVEAGRIWFAWLIIIGNLCHFTLRQWVVPVDKDVPLWWPTNRYNLKGLPAYYTPAQPLIGAGLGILLLASSLLAQDTAIFISYMLVFFWIKSILATKGH